MTKQKIRQQKDSSLHDRTMNFRRHVGLAWLACWMLAAGTLGYRAIISDSVGEAVASISAADSQDQNFTPIEQIQVGERVALAINPTEGFDDSLGTKIHPHVWRKIELRPDAHSRVVLLRPEWWVKERVKPDQQAMSISIPEVGIHGEARIVSLKPCPPIAAGEGRVVIGTFSHVADETIRLTVEDVAEPIRCTPNHATWSVEARDFVEAQELQPGTHVLCADGIRKVVSVEHLMEPIEVFNLEVHGQHVYQITTGGMLVHNAGADGSAPTRVNLGGEGEIPDVINQNGPWIRDPNWRSSRDGKTLQELQDEGHEFVISPNDRLPFADSSVDEVITESVPIDVNTHLGPGVQTSEIERILKPDGVWTQNPLSGGS